MNPFLKLREVPEILGWFQDFLKTCATSVTATGPANSLIMMGPSGPKELAYDLGEPHDTWLRENRILFNTVLWAVLKKYDILARVRRILQRDLGTDGVIEGYGRIALKSYTKELLGEFLLAKPSPNWVFKETTEWGTGKVLASRGGVQVGNVEVLINGDRGAA